jgi:retron-type reverse transcriptase
MLSFDNVDHEWLLKMVAHRVKDPKVLWLIRRFLKAGVLYESQSEAARSANRKLA